jgi:predicted HicB family RNase H-like nuclease
MAMTNKKQGPGKGPTNLSGARGASPVLRVRMPPDLLERAEMMAAAAGVSVADWVRGLIERARK